MAILRLIHSADVPDPAALLERLSGRESSPPAPGEATPQPATAPAAQLPADFRSLVRFLEDNNKALLAQQLHDQVGVVRYAAPELLLKPLRPLGSDWPREVAKELKSLTGTNWTITIAEDAAEPSLLEQERMAEEQVRAEVLQDPGVKAALDAFPEAELESYSLTKGA